MFTFYWLYRNKNSDNWLAVFKTDKKIESANNRESLKKALSAVHYLVGYGNYQESDKFLAKVLTDGKSTYLQEYLSIDLMQEARNCTIEEIAFNLNMDISAKNKEEFCQKRIAVLERVFDFREEYLETKFEIVKEFNLPARSVMKTRANLAAEILKAKKTPKRPNVLMYSYDRYVPKFELPERLLSFYDKIRTTYQNTMEEKLKKEKFKMTLANLTHVYGFGGLHAAKEKYRGEGTFLLIDVKQFFPSIIRNNNFLSVAIKNPKAFDHLYQKKVETENLTYKTLINAVNGSMNNPFSAMFDPQKYFSVTISGQLIITHLILVLENFYEELIQTNTDGILIKINPIMEPIIRELLDLWCQQLHLTVSVHFYHKVFQKDVNNYVFIKKDGSMVKRGIFSEPTYDSSQIPVITRGIFESVVNGVKPQEFVVQAFKKAAISDYFFVGKMHKEYEGIEQQVSGKYVPMNQTICGIATTNEKYGGVFQVKDDLHSKLPGSPPKFLSYEKATKKDLDAAWYIEQIEKNSF